MKVRMITLFSLIVSLSLVFTSAGAAQRPEPGSLPERSFIYSGPSVISSAAPDSTSARGVSPAVALGQPGLSFRYVKTFGRTEEPYIVDSEHLNGVNGISLDSADNLWVAEWNGHRALKYDSNGAFQMSIGSPGPEGELDQLGDVTVGPGGTIWVADAGTDRVVQFSSTGEYLDHLGIRWESGSDNDRFHDPLGVAFDSKGNLYVSDSSNHRIQIFDSSGTYSDTLGVTGEAGSDNAHLNHPDCLFVDENDNLYVADSANHRVQIFDGTGAYSATLGVSGESGWDNDHLDSPSDVTVDSSGSIYVADTNNNRVQIFDSNLKYAATLGETGVSGSDNAHFYWPEGVVVDSNGNIYVSDWGNYRVQKFDSSHVYQCTIGTTSEPYITNNSHFNAPYGVAVDGSGNIILTEERGQRLLKLNSSGVAQWSVGEAGVTGVDNAHFSAPRGTTVDNNGNIHVTEHNNHRVQIYDSDGSYVATLGSGEGDGDYEFQSPSDVAIGPNGYIYVADTWNHRIQVYDSSRIYVATLGVTGSSGTDNAHLNVPCGVLVDSNGSIYVADTFNHRVQVFNSSYVHQLTIGATGASGHDLDHFTEPHDVAVDAVGNIYIADRYNNRVQIFDSTGAYLTTIGGDWGSRTGQFREPCSVDVDAQGNVYIADWDNHRIQKFAPGVPGWRQVNINGFGDRQNPISALDTLNSQMYAGIWRNDGSRTQVWRTADGQTWNQFTPSWSISNTIVFDAQAFESYLYVGTSNDNGGEVWRTNGTSWEQVVSGGFGDGNNGGVNAFAVFSNAIHAATSNDATGVEIWRSNTGNAGTWSQVNSDGFDGAGTTQQDITMDVYSDALYVGLGRGDPPVAELWRTNDGTAWTSVFKDGLAANNTHVSAMAEFGGYFYIGLRNVTTGGEVWRSTDGLVWTSVFTSGLGNPANLRPYGLIVFQDRLYLVFSNMDTGAEMWRTADGTSWERVSEAGWGDSNNGYADYFDKGAAIFNNGLYIGTVNWANGGEVWLMLCQVYLPLVLRNH